MGAGSTSDKFLYINSEISKIGTNRYRMTITLKTSSTDVWNHYGVRVYAHIGVKRIHLGTSKIDDGKWKIPEFTYDFSVTSNTLCYASCQCSYCEDGFHNEYYEQFHNATSPDTATFVNDVPPAPTVPKNVVLSGRYEKDADAPILTWQVPSSNATGCDIQVIYYDYDISNKKLKTATDWIQAEANNGYGRRTMGGLLNGHSAVQARARATGPGGSSAWVNSNILHRHGVRIWDNNRWNYGYCRVYDKDKNEWIQADNVYALVWDGGKYVISQ